MPKIKFVDQTTLVATEVEPTLPYTVSNAVGTAGDYVIAQTYRQGLTRTATAGPELVSFGTILIDTATPDVGTICSAEGFAFRGAVSEAPFWYLDGVQVATADTYTFGAGDRGKTLTYRREATNPGGTVDAYAINQVLLPLSSADVILLFDEWTAAEAISDADTRKTYTASIEKPPIGKRFSVSRRTTEFENVATSAVTDMIDVGAYMEWLSVGRFAPGETGYVQIMMRDEATDTNRLWVSEVKTIYVSNVPGSPTIEVYTGAGQGEIRVVITDPAAENGRPITGYQYSLDGGGWLNLAGGAAAGERVISGTVPVTPYSVRLRGVNVNGEGVASLPQTATSGSAIEPPSAYASYQVTLADSPSISGNKLKLTIEEQPADGGAAITDVKWRSNGGSWNSIGTSLGEREITVTALTAANIELAAENSAGLGDIYAFPTITPSQVSALSTLVEFGDLTPAGHGGWKPVNSAGDEIDITNIVSQTGMTRIWSIDPADNSLIADGTPAVDHGKTITLNVLGQNLVCTINTTNCVANSYSVRTPSQMGSRLGASVSLERVIYVRPVTLDIRTGSTGGLGYFNARNYASAPTHRKVTKHPNQIKRWTFTSYSNLGKTKYLWLDEFESYRASTSANEALVGVRNTTDPTTAIKITNAKFYSPEIDPAVLNDATKWPNGPVGVQLHRGMDLNMGSDHHIENVHFRNMYTCGDYSTDGSFRFINVLVENFYFDALRFRPTGDTTEYKVITKVKITGAFGINNEIDRLDPNTGKIVNDSPHNDGFQFIGSTLRHALISEIEMCRGDYRGVTLQTLQTNSGMNRVVVFNCLLMNKDSPWGYNPEYPTYCVVANSTFAAHDNESSCIRFSAGINGQKSIGLHTVQNTYVRNLGSSSIQNNVGTETNDPGKVEKINCIDSRSSSSFSTNFVGPDSHATTTLTNLRARLTPQVGSDADVDGVGALDTSGNFRTTVWPPLAAPAPTLTNAGVDLVITPAASRYASGTPTVFDYAYRNANGDVWTVVEGASSPSATLVAPNKTGIQVITRWATAGGLKGAWSDRQTVIS
jgi:hypothetical protein